MCCHPAPAQRAQLWEEEEEKGIPALVCPHTASAPRLLLRGWEGACTWLLKFLKDKTNPQTDPKGPEKPQ